MLLGGDPRLQKQVRHVGPFRRELEHAQRL
jgi:hypothetical protein